MPIRSILGTVSMLLLAVMSVLGQSSTISQVSTTTYFSAISTITGTATVTSTSTTSIVLNVSVVAPIRVETDVTSLIAAVFATVAAGVLGAGVGAFIQSRRGGGLLVQGNAVYCKKHGVVVAITPAGLYCPIHREVIA